MGIYYWTVLCYDINKPVEDDNITTLGSMDPLIDKNDINRGFVLTEEIIQFYEKEIKKENIGENTYIIEYCWDSYGLPGEKSINTETRRLPVKSL